MSTDFATDTTRRQIFEFSAKLAIFAAEPAAARPGQHAQCTRALENALARAGEYGMPADLIIETVAEARKLNTWQKWNVHSALAGIATYARLIANPGRMTAEDVDECRADLAEWKANARALGIPDADVLAAETLGALG